MKQLTKRILSLAFALMLFATIVGQVYALDYEPAGIYLRVSGSCVKNENLLNILDTNTHVFKNPDSAYLVTKIQYTDGTNKADTETVLSTTGVTSFDTTFAIREVNNYAPVGVFSTHEVRGGTSDDSEPYAYYTYTDMSDWDFP